MSTKQKIAKAIDKALEREGIGLVITDRDLIITDTNSTAHKFTKLAKDKLCGAEIISFSPELEHYREDLLELTTGDRNEFKLENIQEENKEGKELFKSIRAYTLPGTKEKTAGLVLLFEDTTERNQLERKFVQTHNDIYLLTKKLEEFTVEVMEKKRQLEIQFLVKSVLIDVLPMLLKSSSPSLRDAFLVRILHRIEHLFWKRYVPVGKETDPGAVVEACCQIMNDLGGNFKMEAVGDGTIRVTNDKCPWQGESGKNPILCMMTEGLLKRFVTKADKNAKVVLESSIFDGKAECVLIIRYSA
jgi:PAS domain S-box-containing protein